VCAAAAPIAADGLTTRAVQLAPDQLSQQINEIHSKIENAASSVAAAGAAVSKPIDLSS
jgi:hypothetical protein